MPRRRRRAVQMDLGPLAQIMSQQFQMKKQAEMDRMLQERQAQQNTMITERQGQLAKDQWRRSMLEKAMSDPLLAARLNRMPEFEGQVPLPNPQEVIGGITKGIGGAKTIPDIPSPSGIVGQYQSASGGMPINGPEFLSGLQARDQRTEDLIGEERRAMEAQPVDYESIDDTGNRVQTYDTRGNAMNRGPIQVERTPQQEGSRQAETALTGPLSARVVAGEARKAGAVSGAQTNANLAAEFSPTNITGAAKKAGAVTEAQENAKGPTPEDNKQLTAYLQLIEAHNKLTQIENNPEFSAAESRYAPDFWSSDIAKQYNAAINEYFSSRRGVTGANLTGPEIEVEKGLATATPFGGPDVVRQIQNARMNIIKGQQQQAAKGIKRFNQMGNQVPLVVDPNSADQLDQPTSALDRLRSRNAGRSGTQR